MINTTIPSVEFAGMFKIIKKIGDVVTYEGNWQKNLITDNGLDMLGRVDNVMNTLHLSADNTQPKISDTQVVSLIRSSNGSNVSLLHPYNEGRPYYSEQTRKYSFAPTGEAFNCSKIHLSGGDPNDIFSSALIKDTDDNPTTLSVKAVETLEIIYAVRQYYDTDIKTSTMTLEIDRGAGIKTEVYDVRVRVFAAGVSAISNYGWSLVSPALKTNAGYTGGYRAEIFCSGAALPSNLQGTLGSSRFGTMTASKYLPSSLKLSASVHLARGDANFTDGVRTLAVASDRGYYCIEYTSQTTGKGIPKTSFDELTLNFDFSWDRYEGAL